MIPFPHKQISAVRICSAIVTFLFSVRFLEGFDYWLNLTIELSHGVFPPLTAFSPFSPSRVYFVLEPSQKSDAGVARPNEQFCTILMWTSWFRDPKWSDAFIDIDISPGYVSSNRILTGNFTCEDFQISKTCTLTNDRRMLEKADVVVFHQPDFNRKDLPRIRYPWQRWAYMMMESPQNAAKSFGFYHENIYAANGLGFNWTISYSRQADIMWPYGRIVPLDYSSINFLNLIRQMQKHITTFYKRPFDACWISSHCPTLSKREDVIKLLLNEGTKIATCGACALSKQNASCPRTGKDRYTFYEQCRFVLAFENTLCDDYASEKFYNALRAAKNSGAIPVTFGGADYAKIFNPDYYLIANQFSSVQKLAQKLMSYRNPGMQADVAKRLSWQFKYDVTDEAWHAWPHKSICKKLMLNADPYHQQSAKTISDIREPMGKCYEPTFFQQQNK